MDEQPPYRKFAETQSIDLDRQALQLEELEISDLRKTDSISPFLFSLPCSSFTIRCLPLDAEPEPSYCTSL